MNPINEPSKPPARPCAWPVGARPPVRVADRIAIEGEAFLACVLAFRLAGIALARWGDGEIAQGLATLAEAGATAKLAQMRNAMSRAV